jgi:hypothetical protein
VGAGPSSALGRDGQRAIGVETGRTADAHGSFYHSDLPAEQYNPLTVVALLVLRKVRYSTICGKITRFDIERYTHSSLRSLSHIRR